LLSPHVFSPTDRIVTVTLDPSTITSIDPDEVHEWRVAIYDLIDDNKFAPAYSVLGTLLAFRPKGIDEALGLIRRAVSLEPSVVGHRVALAEALLLAGQSEEAEHIAIRIVARARSMHEREVGQKLLQLTATAVASHQHQ